MTAKKRKLIIIIVSAVLVVAIALSLSLGLTLGLKNKEWSSVFAIGEDVMIDLAPVGRNEILSSDVKVQDLSDAYREKLFKFTEFSKEDAIFWFSDNIFRNRSLDKAHALSNIPYDLEHKVLPLVEAGYISQSEYESILGFSPLMSYYGGDWEQTYSYKDGLSVRYMWIENMSESKYSKKYFGGRTSLADGEILVSKWVYYSLYARLNSISIDIEKVQNILDSENTVAKHVILRNCMGMPYGADGFAMEYYGLLPADLSEELEIVLCDTIDGGVRKQSYKVVGYFEDEIFSETRLKEYYRVSLNIYATPELDENYHKENMDYDKELFQEDMRVWREMDTVIYANYKSKANK